MGREDDGAYAPSRSYRSLADFYRGDPRRPDSRECDIGLWWREGPAGPLHRAAWVSDTGELYLVRLGPERDGGGAVEVLATVSSRERLERVLAGWRERCGEPRSLSWLRERAARLRRRTPVTHRRVAGRMTAAPTMLAGAASLARELP